MGTGILVGWTIALCFPLFIILLLRRHLKNVKPATELADRPIWATSRIPRKDTSALHGSAVNLSSFEKEEF